MTENTNPESTVVEPAPKRRSRFRNWLWFKPSGSPKPKPAKPRKVRLSAAAPEPERIVRDWQYRETREGGFPFPTSRNPRRRFLRFVRGLSYWVRSFLTFAFVIALLLLIVWAVGELRIYGYGPANIWTLRAARFAIWVNVHLGGK